GLDRGGEVPFSRREAWNSFGEYHRRESLLQSPRAKAGVVSPFRRIFAARGSANRRGAAVACDAGAEATVFPFEFRGDSLHLPAGLPAACGPSGFARWLGGSGWTWSHDALLP